MALENKLKLKKIIKFNKIFKHILQAIATDRVQIIPVNIAAKI